MSLQPFAKIEVGMGGESQTFAWGDGKLRAVSVTLSEGKGISGCTFSIYDEDRKVTDAFMAYVKEIDGLEPVEEPGQATGNEPETSASPAISGQAPPAGTYGGSTLTAEQTGHAYTLASVGASLGATRWDLEVLLMTALQESSLRNLRGGDRDSAGLIQQRPSQGWGSYAEVTNPSYAAGAFFRGAGTNKGLFDYPNRQQQFTKAQAAQKVQVSAFPSAYAVWEDEAIALLNAMSVNYQGAELTPEQETSTSQEAATQSTAKRNPDVPGRSETLAGQQITLYLGFDGKPLVAYSFIHTGLSYSLYDQSTLEFTGTAAAWVMHQAPKNSAYTNLSLKQLAEKIAANYGLVVDMQVEGPRYVYISQKALTDYQFLLQECERVGLIIKNVGNNTLEIKARSETLEQGNDNIYTLAIGKNLNNFSVSHQAQSAGGSARSSEPGEQNSTGVKKFKLNPDSGEIEEETAETKDAKGGDETESTTGSNFDGNHPLTTGVTELEDEQRKANEQRVKGIEATYSAPSTPEILILTPDDPIRTEKLGGFLNRIWVHESVTHTLSTDSGFVTSGKIYTPLKNKYPTPEPAAAAAGANAPPGGDAPNSNSGGFIRPVSQRINSPFGQRWGRLHGGVDFACPIGTAIWASAAGTVESVTTSCPLNGFRGSGCGGGFGNNIVIAHAGGIKTYYCHLDGDNIYVAPGATVRQGQQIAKSGNSGSSTGPHLHFEFRVGGTRVDPQRYI
ncbi:peptidoglycan DD-metalloendopeptidase family protein [Nodosilinea sp. LEGE 07298]|uniref:peptidoglycan DD-metalloendopeptidase family protein n=1 Tax=Nodosilinea sp. LEGE 07298 TaxID=2777970 RepID=UPI00187F989D|nr:peptidoglycan DD-metalloendopeptidase family protein [Nodosilinea sp. LEGE 07298]MBE9110313.1 peptidoglycan DD-metalloendopeptidase family protein [Nodosilinea sp. LEGE 07298]